MRYRYYISQALLQNKRGAGSIGRVPAAEIETLVLAALRDYLQASGAAEPHPIANSDRQLIERLVERITLTRRHIKLQMRPSPTLLMR